MFMAGLKHSKSDKGSVVESVPGINKISSSPAPQNNKTRQNKENLSQRETIGHVHTLTLLVNDNGREYRLTLFMETAEDSKMDNIDHYFSSYTMDLLAFYNRPTLANNFYF